jgi:periplasmic copper chaperone A
MTCLRTSLIVLSLNLIALAQPSITAADAWVSEAAAGGTAVAGLTITNPTMYDIYIVAATSDAAGKVELREGDKAVKHITVPSFGFVELTAAGPHVVLMDLKSALKAGGKVTLTLETDGGVTVVTTAVVKALP